MGCFFQRLSAAIVVVFFSPFLFLANEKPTPPDVHYQTKPHGVWLDVFLSIFSV